MLMRNILIYCALAFFLKEIIEYRIVDDVKI